MSNSRNGKSIFMYVNYTPEDRAIGITKKISAQISTLRKMGFKVTYSAYILDGVGIYDNDDKLIYSEKYMFENKTYQRYARRFQLINAVIKYFNTIDKKFDYSYLRWHSFDNLYIKMLKVMKESGCKVIIEAHAFTPNMKGNNLPDKYTVFMDKIFSKKAKDYVDLVAGISEYDHIWGINTVKIDNAIMLEEIPERKWIKSKDCIRLLSVANEYSYHGFDRLIEGIYNYYIGHGQEDIMLKLVGVYQESTKELVRKYNLSDRVMFYGKKSGKELDDIYDESDIGIGALAHHRIGMYSGSSLKTKEYFAKGLPFIYGWKEPKFDDTYPYAMRIPLNEEPIIINDVLNFYYGIKDDSMMLENMRVFSLNNYSWESEFERIFKVLEED